MFSARTIIWNYCYKKSVKHILTQVKWISAKQLVTWAGVKAIHKIIFNKKPASLYQHFNIKSRKCAKIYPKTFPIKKFSKDLYLNKSLETYNRLPLELKTCNPQTFKKKGLKFIKSNYDVH